ncbi:hypothetical protein OS493_031684, partial [Desmophyllum pertusum]
RSYEVEVEGRSFRRNRRQLRFTLEPPPDPSSNIEEVNPTQAQNGSSSHVAPDQDPDPPVPENRESNTPSPTRSVPEGTETDSGTPPRRSCRARHPPAWLDDYDLC